MPERIRLHLIFTGLICLFSGPALTAQLLPNGGFEKGNLENWEDQSSSRAVVEVVQRNTCFLQQDTRDLQIRGNHAALLRAEMMTATPQSGTSLAALRSSTFVAGDGFAFIALRGHQGSVSKSGEPDLLVELLDAKSGSVLVSQDFSPTGVLLSTGCPSNPTPGQFSSHYFDTRSYAGRAIKIQFKQAFDNANSQVFTLIDQLVLFPNGEQALFFSRPHAQAGISITSSGIPYLDSRGSFDPDQHPSPLRFSWWFKNQHYASAQPCLINFLGDHQAVLYVNDGQHAISDSLQFYLHTAVGELAQSSDLKCDLITPIINAQKLNPDPGHMEVAGQAQQDIMVKAPEENKTVAEKIPLLNKHEQAAQLTGKPGKTKPPVLQSEQIPQASTASPVNEPFDSVSKVNFPLKSLKIVPVAVLSSASEANQIRDSIEKSKVELASAKIPATTAEPVKVQIPKLTELNLNAYNLAKSGIHWEPRSQKNGKLLMTTPAFFPKQKVKLIDRNGTIIETASYVDRHEKRARYAFSKEGAAYPLNCILRVGNTDYLVRTPGSPVN